MTRTKTTIAYLCALGTLGVGIIAMKHAGSFLDMGLGLSLALAGTILPAYIYDKSLSKDAPVQCTYRPAVPSQINRPKPVQKTRPPHTRPLNLNPHAVRCYVLA